MADLISTGCLFPASRVVMKASTKLRRWFASRRPNQVVARRKASSLLRMDWR